MVDHSSALQLQRDGGRVGDEQAAARVLPLPGLARGGGGKLVEVGRRVLVLLQARRRDPSQRCSERSTPSKGLRAKNS